MGSGVLIEFSGVDGSGKSTQMQLLCDSLSKQGHKCMPQDFYERKFYDMATKNEKCDSIRNIFSVETAEILMLCDELIYREEHTMTLIEQGYIVVSARSIYDRYLKAKLYSAKNAHDIKKLCQYSLSPSLHFYLSVTIDKCIERIIYRGTDLEDESLMKSYINILENEAKSMNWIYVDSNMGIYDVHASILKRVLDYLKMY